MSRYKITQSCSNPRCSYRKKEILSAVNLDAAYTAANQMNSIKENRTCPACGEHLTYYPHCDDRE